MFLEFHLEDFASKHDEAKLIDIIQKTWNKMSDAGHTAGWRDIDCRIGRSAGDILDHAVGVERLVRPVKGADAKMHDADGDGARVIRGARERGGGGR